ncbi:hypothetical protein K7G98_43380, partial [Saccharothrix sp. MB29]|nr:hypothetical protein [Saccharothrix sp. MB29]
MDSALHAQLAYWEAALAGVPAELPLPADRPRGPLASTEGGIVVFSVPPAVRDDLLVLAKDNQASLFMVVQAA